MASFAMHFFGHAIGQTMASFAMHFFGHAIGQTMASFAMHFFGHAIGQKLVPCKKQKAFQVCGEGLKEAWSG